MLCESVKWATRNILSEVFGDPKVNHFDVPGIIKIPDEVVWLDIPVDQMSIVNVLDCLADLASNPYDLAQVERTFLLDMAAEVTASKFHCYPRDRKSLIIF